MIEARIAKKKLSDCISAEHVTLLWLMMFLASKNETSYSFYTVFNSYKFTPSHTTRDAFMT